MLSWYFEHGPAAKDLATFLSSKSSWFFKLLLGERICKRSFWEFTVHPAPKSTWFWAQILFKELIREKTTVIYSRLLLHTQVLTAVSEVPNIWFRVHASHNFCFRRKSKNKKMIEWKGFSICLWYVQDHLLFLTDWLNMTFFYLLQIRKKIWILFWERPRNFSIIWFDNTVLYIHTLKYIYYIQSILLSLCFISIKYPIVDIGLCY